MALQPSTSNLRLQGVMVSVECTENGQEAVCKGQSGGQSESGGQCKVQSEILVILNWCNTPGKGMSTSPSECMVGRKSHTLLPWPVSLQPHYDTPQEDIALRGLKLKQLFFNRSAHAHADISNPVSIMPPGSDTWTQGICLGKVTPHQCEVQCGPTIYHRNKSQLFCSQVSTPSSMTDDIINDTPEKPRAELKMLYLYGTCIGNSVSSTACTVELMWNEDH